MKIYAISPGDRVLVAVSGGPDSLSLLHLLHTERDALGLAWLGVAHLDHSLRGEESAAEAAFVARFCAERQIPCEIGQADTHALQKAQHISTQQAARAVRYQFLESVAEQVGATKIATAHTQDDQIETVLLNILRGTGLDGLRGIPQCQGLFVRPFLEVTRAQIEAYCRTHALDPRHDPSNSQTEAYTRNRIRGELLPLLERDYAPGVRQALLRLSETAARDSDYLHSAAQSALDGATVSETPGVLVLSRAALAEIHPGLLRHTLRAAATRVRGTATDLTASHLQLLCRAITTPTVPPFGLTTPSPACQILVQNDWVTFRLSSVPSPLSAADTPLTVPGLVVLGKTGWTVESAVRPFSESVGVSARLDLAQIDRDTLHIRVWRAGDRIAPLGMGGKTKKLQDLFTDAKVPRLERVWLPIVADVQGIVWVAGLALAERVKVTETTQNEIFFRAFRREPPGQGDN